MTRALFAVAATWLVVATAVFLLLSLYEDEDGRRPMLGRFIIAALWPAWLFMLILAGFGSARPTGEE